MREDIGIRKIDIRTEADLEGKRASLEAVLEAANGETEIYLWAQLMDQEGNEADRIFPIPLEEQMQFCMEVKEAELWNGEQPYIYRLVLELRDRENRLLGTTAKRIGFCRWEEREDGIWLNGKKVEPLLFPWDTKTLDALGTETEWEERAREILSEGKRSCGNGIVVPKSERRPGLEELCLEYGVYLLEKAPAVPVCKTSPYFEIQVVNQGALVENRCTFADAREFDLIYEIRKENHRVQQGRVRAEIPAGTSRYVELPFQQPGEAGEYIYKAAFCLPEDTLWAEKGFEIAAGEAVITNFYTGDAKR